MRNLIACSALCCLLFALAACDQESSVSPIATDETIDESDFGPDEDDGSLLKGEQNFDFGVGPTVRSYEITLENLTPNNGGGAAQVFSPPVYASHNRGVRMFRVGRVASKELAGIAEDAINQPMLDLLAGSRHVFQSGSGDGVIPPGASANWEVQTRAGARRLSMAFMLVNTNDGFGGVDSIQLPRRGEVEHYLYAYDAGSEENTELISDIPGPCCGNPEMGTPTKKRIAKHPGLHGKGDLDPATWGWEGPVAKLTIRRIAPTYELTLENMAPDTGDGGAQVFSPPVIATHGHGVRMFRVGHFASEELAGIAEDAINQPMIDLLEGSDRVRDVVVGGGVIFPGTSDQYTITGDHRNRRLSMAFMLVNTNDAFSGVNSARLPVAGRVSYYLRAYDAGSEENTELFSDIPGPCCGNPEMGPPTHERIRPHAGIQGTGDLSVEKWGWDEPVAKLTFTRVK